MITPGPLRHCVCVCVCVCVRARVRVLQGDVLDGRPAKTELEAAVGLPQTT